MKIKALTDQQAGYYVNPRFNLAQAKASWNKFRDYVDSKATEGLNTLNQYNNQLPMSGSGKRKGKGKRKTGKALLHSIHMRGGSWSDFTDWVKGAASTVGNVVKGTAKSIWGAIKDKPLSTIGKVLGAASMIPTPLSGHYERRRQGQLQPVTSLARELNLHRMPHCNPEYPLCLMPSTLDERLWRSNSNFKLA
jgi:hypothetical protein